VNCAIYIDHYRVARTPRRIRGCEPAAPPASSKSLAPSLSCSLAAATVRVRSKRSVNAVTTHEPILRQAKFCGNAHFDDCFDVMTTNTIRIMHTVSTLTTDTPVALRQTWGWECSPNVTERTGIEDVDRERCWERTVFYKVLISNWCIKC
jgi:hypothetical protein